MVKISKIKRFLCLILLLGDLTFGVAPIASAQESSDLGSFSAVWKLMSTTDRERFISGYLRGWKDASGFLDIAIEYVKSNPAQAADALIKLRELANLGDQKPGALAIFIDQFYKNPENQGAPLSKAVSAARSSGISVPQSNIEGIEQ